MGRLAGELDLDLGDRQAPSVNYGMGRRMKHHRGIDPVKKPCLDHLHLPPIPFLGGGVHEKELPRKVGLNLTQGKAGTKGGGRDQVVPAGVSDLRESVVLTEDCHRRSVTRCWAGRLDRRVQAGHAKLN